MIYLDKLNTKLNAILNKNVAAITNAHVYIPFVGNNYTQTQLQNWLQKRIDVLVDVRDGNYTDVQIQNFIDFVYKKLSASDKLIADKIITGEPFDLTSSDAENYENLVVIILYKFVSTE